MDGLVENTVEEEISGEAGNMYEMNQEQDGQIEAESAEKRWPGWPGESVFRIMIPAHKAGGLIGRKGEFIKKMCEESKARIKILDGPPGVPERAVSIFLVGLCSIQWTLQYPLSHYGELYYVYPWNYLIFGKY